MALTQIKQKMVDGLVAALGGKLAVNGANVGDDAAKKAFLANVGVDTSGAEGDLYYRNSAGLLTKLPKGTAGQKLRQNAALTAPEWESGWETIYNGVLAAAAQHDFTNLGDFEMLEIDAHLVSTVTGAELQLRFSNDDGSSFISSNDYLNQFIYAISTSPATVHGTGSARSNINLCIAVPDNVAGSNIWGRISALNKAERTYAFLQLAGLNNVNTALYCGINQGFFSTFVAQNAIRFTASSGNISGRLLLRGKRG